MDASVQKIGNKRCFDASLTVYQNDKIKKFTVNNTEQAHGIRDNLLKIANGKLIVNNVEKKQRRKQPAPPFITSTLQQEAARKLGFSAKKTMSIAQQLYEGINIGSEAVGLITYMRTDSVNLANEAVAEIREVISERYGKENLPKTPHSYKTKSKNAQEAHEAIRPTSARHYPQELKEFLTIEQLKLYTLVWQRSISCQMIHATFDTVAMDLTCGDSSTFRATGSVLKQPGFRAVYLEGVDDQPVSDKERLLPVLSKGDLVNLLDIKAEQHFTEPPPRYTEARLIKTLEEHGIGRPSTYATIVSTLQQREYVEYQSKRFIPTDVGEIVNKFLTEHFTKYVDYAFTASLEDDLDAVSRGEQKWIPLLDKFWHEFKQRIDEKQESVQRKDLTQEALDEKCPKCEETLILRLGKRGKFIGCSAYPKCKYTRNMDGEETPEEPEIIEGRSCPKCSENLLIKKGRYGKFVGCSNYPKCKYMEPLEKPEDTDITCPECEKGTLLKRKSRYNKIFFSCSSYPKCKYAVWNKPIVEACPKCKWPILTIKTTKRRGTEKVCPQKACDFTESIAEVETKE
jgi:DNA topoisomerase-1